MFKIRIPDTLIQNRYKTYISLLYITHDRVYVCVLVEQFYYSYSFLFVCDKIMIQYFIYRKVILVDMFKQQHKVVCRSIDFF